MYIDVLYAKFKSVFHQNDDEEKKNLCTNMEIIITDSLRTTYLNKYRYISHIHIIRENCGEPLNLCKQSNFASTIITVPHRVQYKLSIQHTLTYVFSFGTYRYILGFFSYRFLSSIYRIQSFSRARGYLIVRNTIRIIFLVLTAAAAAAAAAATARFHIISPSGIGGRM